MPLILEKRKKEAERMKMKPKESFYAEKKFRIHSRCGKCGRAIVLEKVYIGHNGPNKFYFCTDCIGSIEEAREASKIKRPKFQAPVK